MEIWEVVDGGSRVILQRKTPKSKRGPSIVWYLIFVFVTFVCFDSSCCPHSILQFQYFRSVYFPPESPSLQNLLRLMFCASKIPGSHSLPSRFLWQLFSITSAAALSTACTESFMGLLIKGDLRRDSPVLLTCYPGLHEIFTEWPYCIWMHLDVHWKDGRSCRSWMTLFPQLLCGFAIIIA